MIGLASSRDQGLWVFSHVLPVLCKSDVKLRFSMRVTRC